MGLKSNYYLDSVIALLDSVIAMLASIIILTSIVYTSIATYLEKTTFVAHNISGEDPESEHK